MGRWIARWMLTALPRLFFLIYSFIYFYYIRSSLLCVGFSLVGRAGFPVWWLLGVDHGLWGALAQ